MKLQIHATGFELDRELEKYVDGKLAEIYKTLPRKLRAQASCDISFAQSGQDTHKLSTCSVAVTFDDTMLQVQEATQHMYAALDVAVVHLQQRLENYLVAHGYKQQRGQWRLP